MSCDQGLALLTTVLDNILLNRRVRTQLHHDMPHVPANELHMGLELLGASKEVRELNEFPRALFRSNGTAKARMSEKS